MGRAKRVLFSLSQRGLWAFVVLVCGWLSCTRQADQPAAPAGPSATPAKRLDFSSVDRVIEQAIGDGDIPGAVILIGNAREVLHRRAFGWRAVQPQPLPMTPDTVFDLASLTKTVATATSVMLLWEQGRLALNDPVAKVLPAFAANGKAHVTIEQLFIHAAGLIADNPLKDYDSGIESAYAAIDRLGLERPAGEKFVYSDVGYIVLARLVETLAAQEFDVFVRERVLKPLGMTDTAFRPDDALRARCAVTERRDGRWLRGEVHDPRADQLGGVAGHAGLFSTADDLARFARMILNLGRVGEQVFLKEATIRAMVRPRPSGKNGVLRGLGWDISSPYASARGDVFELGTSFGHTGFTGTSIWIAPQRNCYVILLTNRVHPDGKGRVVSLRREVATLTAQTVGRSQLKASTSLRRMDDTPTDAPANARVVLGIDVLAGRGFDVLDGRHVGLIANHTSKNAKGQSTSAVLDAAEGVDLVKLFSPEHGLRGKVDALVDDSTDPETGLPVLSLYNESKRPTPAMLAGIDTLVFDIQDIGVRFYTYISTMLLAMEAASERDIRFVVLDRPNPLTGLRAFGPVADEGRASFTCPHPIPVTHGMTIGELATMFNRQRGIEADLVVIKMAGWRRSMWWDEAGIAWINPSPNIRNLTEAILYPAVGVWERTNISVGRGTETPFEHFGAPWIDGNRLAEALTGAGLAGVSFSTTRFTPTTSVFAGQTCEGVRLSLTDRNAFDPAATAMTIAVTLRDLFGDKFDTEKLDALLIHRKTAQAIRDGQSAEEILATFTSPVAGYQQTAKRYWLYPQ